jgi:hypothetical protein
MSVKSLHEVKDDAANLRVASANVIREVFDLLLLYVRSDTRFIQEDPVDVFVPLADQDLV